MTGTDTPQCPFCGNNAVSIIKIVENIYDLPLSGADTVPEYAIRACDRCQNIHVTPIGDIDS